MASCPNCSTSVVEGKFCPNCGAPVSHDQTAPLHQPAPGYQSPVGYQTAPSYPTMPAAKRPLSLGRKLLVGGIALVAVAVVGGLGLQWGLQGPARKQADQFLAAVQAKDQQTTCALSGTLICTEILKTFRERAGDLQTYQYEGIEWVDPLQYRVVYSYTGTVKSDTLGVLVAVEGKARVFYIETPR